MLVFVLMCILLVLAIAYASHLDRRHKRRVADARFRGIQRWINQGR